MANTSSAVVVLIPDAEAAEFVAASRAKGDIAITINSDGGHTVIAVSGPTVTHTEGVEV